jgi:hypothetical protein
MHSLGPAIASLVILLPAGPFATQEAKDAPKPKKPSISIKANPNVSFSPARIVFVAELRGGSDDFEEFYCATVEWEWGDGTESENTVDCEPYEAGKSKIQRHFSTQHRYEPRGSTGWCFA